MAVCVELANPGSQDVVQLAENGNWLAEHAFLIDLGQAAGSRRLTFDVDPNFDTSDTDVLVGDLLQVYLVDPINPGTTLLDRGREGEALFSLSERGADFLPGLVTFDGLSVRVDLTSLADETEGVLVFQLINGDADEGTQVAISNISNELDPEGVLAPSFVDSAFLAQPGDAVVVADYAPVPTSAIQVLVENIRVDGEAGSYIADLKLRNMGDAISRAILVSINDLPAGVELTNASGSDALGSPYLNLSPAVTSGGLDRSATTTPVELRISNPNAVRFELNVDVLTAGPNLAPIFAPIGNVQVMPGDVFSVMLNATDPDDDRITFSLDFSGPMPTTRLLADGTLEFKLFRPHWASLRLPLDITNSIGTISE